MISRICDPLLIITIGPAVANVDSRTLYPAITKYSFSLHPSFRSATCQSSVAYFHRMRHIKRPCQQRKLMFGVVDEAAGLIEAAFAHQAQAPVMDTSI